jgi:tetratricopeptide (TPR) repeat protein
MNCDRLYINPLTRAYSRAAAAYTKMDDLKNARHYYQKSLTEHRTPITLTKLSEIEKRIKEETLLAYIDPEISLQEKTKGNEMFAKGDYPGAIKHYSEAIKRNPQDAKIYSNRAACYQKLTEFQLALKDCDECIRLEPNFIKGHIRKGLALIAMKELNKAQAAFQQALQIDPNSQEALDNYRKCQMTNMSNPEDARKRAMHDPEIQQILADPAMRMILDQMQQDPKAAQEHLRNPDIMSKIEKLLSAGLIGIR